MTAHWISARTVVEEKPVEEYVNECTFPRFEEAFSALKWLLARKCADVGLRAIVAETEYRLYRQASDEVAGTPSIIVVYTYTANEVRIVGIKAEASSATRA